MNATCFVLAIASLVLLNGFNAFVVEMEKDKMEAVDVKDFPFGTLSPCTNPDRVCHWRGTAPICDGECEIGETVCDEGQCGDGKCCITGKKVLCCRDL